MKDKDFDKVIEFACVKGALSPTTTLSTSERSAEWDIPFRRLPRDLSYRAYMGFISYVYAYLPDSFKIPPDKFYVFLKHIRGITMFCSVSRTERRWWNTRVSLLRAWRRRNLRRTLRSSSRLFMKT